MLSPHARARQRSLFWMAVDEDRRRRAAGLPEREREPRERVDVSAITGRIRLAVTGGRMAKGDPKGG